MLPAGLHRILLGGWMVVPVLEIAVAGAIATHVVVLGLLGPLGHRTNAVVWPWNAAMAALATSRMFIIAIPEYAFGAA